MSLAYRVIDGKMDIVEEALYYFKANVFFKNYEIKVRFQFITVQTDPDGTVLVV